MFHTQEGVLNVIKSMHVGIDDTIFQAEDCYGRSSLFAPRRSCISHWRDKPLALNFEGDWPIRRAEVLCRIQSVMLGYLRLSVTGRLH